MQTRKLYYEDCLQQEFTARVLSCEEKDGLWQVVLDATAFYPEGGGQACDRGTLGGVNVLQVQQQGETVLHLCDNPLPPGQTVAGKIDWPRRLDLQQQHTGEHIVSGIIHALYGCSNVGFHVGADTVTIDFDHPIPSEDLAQIEQAANDAIYRNLPVKCWYPTREQLQQLPYRSKKQLDWPVRIVEIPGIDICACCGVHTAYTGQVGIIKLLSCVKFHQGVRIEMVCGGRALDYLSAIWEQNRQVSRAFSAKPLETGAAAQRMADALAAEKFRSAALERQVFDCLAKDYVNRGNVLHLTVGLSSAALRELAERISLRCGGVAAVFSGCDGEGYSLCLAGSECATSSLGQQLRQDLGAKGGGKGGFFQGSVAATREEIKAFFGKLSQFYVTEN